MCFSFYKPLWLVSDKSSHINKAQTSNLITNICAFIFSPKLLPFKNITLYAVAYCNTLPIIIF